MNYIEEPNLYKSLYIDYKSNKLNTILKSIGLNFSYSEDELDLIDNYFRYKRDLPEGLPELLSRSIFVFYIYDILVNNNKNMNIKMNIKDVKNDYSSKDIEFEIIHLNSTISILPLVKLGNINFAKEYDVAPLKDWCKLAVLSNLPL